MIEVTRLNGKKYWLNPHLIESMEEKPDLTVVLITGKIVVLKDKPQEVIDKINAGIRGIQRIASNCL